VIAAHADGDGFNAPEAYTKEAFLGELPEGLSGSTKRVVGVERSATHVGGPDGSWGARHREATRQGSRRP
jgi:hypothetical protein